MMPRKSSPPKHIINFKKKNLKGGFGNESILAYLQIYNIILVVFFIIIKQNVRIIFKR